MVEPSLSIKGLRAGYGSLDILNGVDLDVPQGQFVALMGPNGAGKSTLLKTLYGMTTVKGGSINWQGKDISALKSRAILAEGISWVPQGRCNFPVMTVDENLQMAAYTLRDSKVKAERDYVYNLFPILKTRRNTLAGNMSGRRAAAARSRDGGAAAAKDPARRRALGRSVADRDRHRVR
ncbi:ABC-type branched-subunit amino acid transport system ATPase component [Bradyrhizobium diazoefficiens]